MRLQYPPEVEIILMPCSGRVDIIHLLKAFEAGSDAVFVAGCLEGECHYLTGNLKAKKRVNKLKKDLAQMGIEPERLEMFNLSSSEGPRFAAICQEMSERAHISQRLNNVCECKINSGPAMAIEKGPTLVIVTSAEQPAAGRAKQAQTCRHQGYAGQVCACPRYNQ